MPFRLESEEGQWRTRTGGTEGTRRGPRAARIPWLWPECATVSPSPKSQPRSPVNPLDEVIGPYPLRTPRSQVTHDCSVRTRSR